MRRLIEVLIIVFLAVETVRSDERAVTNESEPVSESSIEFYDEEVDFGDELSLDPQTAEHLHRIAAMVPRVHNKILDHVVSPNGNHVVYIVERDSGATTCASLHVFLGRPVQPAEETTFNEKRLGEHIFMGDRTTTQVRCEWRDDTHLMIYSDGEATFLRADLEGITILHNK